MAETFRQVLEVAFQVLGQDEAQKLADALAAVGEAGDDADGKLAPLVDEFLSLADASAKVSAAIDISERLQKNDAALTEAKAALAALNTEFDRADKSSAEVQIAFEQAEKRVRSLASEQLKLQTASAQSADALKRAGVDVADLGKAQADLKSKAAGVADKIADTGKAASAAGKNMKDAGDGAKHLGDEARSSGGILGELRDNLGKIITVAGAVSLALKGIEFGKERFAEAADLEESLTRVRALAGDAQASLAGYETGIRDAAAQAGVTANTAAAAMAGLVQQGRSADEALQALVPTLLLAKTAQMDVAQAAGIVDGALSQFGGSAADAANYVDILVAAAKGSKDGIAGLTDGVTKLAPLARDLNLTFQDTAGILGFMTRNGLSAGDATKGLGAIFRDLKDPASNLRQELFALGDGTSDFDTAINTLATSGDRGKDAILRLDDSTRKVVLFLQQQGVQGLQQFRAGLDNAAGSASALSTALGDNLNGAWDDFTRAIDTIGAQLAQPVLEPLKLELQSLAARLTEFAKSPAFAQLQAEIGELARNGVAALDTLLRGIDWSEFVNGARSAIQDASTSIASVKDDLQGVADAINVVAGVLGVLYRAFAVVFDGAKILISGAVAASAELGVVIGKVIDAAKGSESAYTQAMEAIRDSAVDAANNGVDALAKNGDKLKENLEAIAGASGPAAAGLDTVGRSAARIHASFANVSAGVESTRVALQRFDVPPGTFDNVVSGGEQAGKAMADLTQRIADAQREATSAQAELDRLSRSGEANAQALQQAASAVDTASQRLHALQGQASVAASGADALKAALSALGVTAQQDVARGAETAAKAFDTVFAAYQQGKATIEDARAAFEAYSAKQLEAVKNSDAWKQQQVKDALDVKRAMLGVAEVKPSPDFSRSTEGVKRFEEQAQKAGDAVKEVGEKGKEGASQVSSGFAELANIYTAWTNKFGESSAAAAARFQELTQNIQKFGVSLNVYAQADVIGFVKLGEAISEASRRTQEEIDEQKRRVTELSSEYQSMSAAAIQTMAAQQGGAEALARSFEAQAAAARSGQSQLQLLGASDLSPLASALDGVAAKARQLADQAMSARESFADLASSLKEQIAQQQGDLTSAENIRFQNQLEQLRKQAQESNTIGSAEYAEAVQRATQLHNLKLKQLKEQAEAQKRNDEDEARRKRDADKAPSETDPNKTQPPKGGVELGVIRFDIGNGQVINVRGTRETAADLQGFVRMLEQQRRLQPGRASRGGF